MTRRASVAGLVGSLACRPVPDDLQRRAHSPTVISSLWDLLRWMRESKAPSITETDRLWLKQMGIRWE